MSLNRLQQLSLRDSSLKLRCENINSTISYTGEFYLYGKEHITIQEVVQLAQPTQTVDCGSSPKDRVRVHTNLFTTPANSYTGFHLLNTLITANSVVTATILSYDGTYGTQGLPVAFTYNLQPGDIEIGVMNTGNTALNGNFYILVEIKEKI